MTRKFLTSVDLTQNELKQAVLEKLGSAPGSPVEGQLYYDTVAGAVKVRDATNFKKLVASGTIANADVAAGAGIVYSKLDLSASIVAGDLAASLKPSGSAVDADEAVRALGYTSGKAMPGTTTLNNVPAATGDVNINSNKVTNVDDPTNAQDAATKAYVDLMTGSGLRTFKDSVRVATNAALPANTRTGNTLDADGNGALTIDGVAVDDGDRVLVKNEATGANNGIYVVTDKGSAGTPFQLDRAGDADTSTEVKAGMYMIVDQGTANADSAWVLATNDPITLNTTSLSFTKFTTLQDLVAGAGLTKSSNTLDIVAASGSGIVVNADNIDIDPTNGLPVNRGGTGAITAAGAKTSLGFMTRFTQSIGNGSATDIAVTHNLGTRDVQADVYDAATFESVEADVVRTSTNVVTFSFGVAPASNAYRVVIIG